MKSKKRISWVLSIVFLMGVLIPSHSFSSLTASAVEQNISGPISERVGVIHVKGLYNFTSTKDFLNEGADKILDLGSKVIKLWFTPNYRTDYAFNSSWANATTLVELAQTPYFSNVFSKPFKTFVLETFEFNPQAWKFGLNSTQVNSIKSEFYLLTKYLMQTYQNTNKTFILQNWEGDNALKGVFDQLSTDAEKNIAIQGMKDWLNARQDGIDQAKNELGAMGIDVYGCVEVNKVSTPYTGQPRLIDVIVPYTHADLYSYSLWETGTDAGQLWDNLTTIEIKAPNSSAFGSKNIIIGEFGAPENDLGSDAAQLNQIKIQLETALAWGVQYALYWQIFCNEAYTTYTPPARPTNSQLGGYWLIRPDGTYSSTWNYLKTMCRQGCIYDDMNNFNTMSSHTTNLTIDASSPDYFDHDITRVVRCTTNTVENCIYYSGSSTKDITGFKVGVYYDTSIAGKFKVYTSPDNIGSNWQELSITSEMLKNTGLTWYRAVFKPTGNIPSGTKYLKFELSNDTKIYTPQLSRAIIYTTEVVDIPDELDNFNRIFSHSTNWVFDSSSPAYMEGDTSRLTRTTDTWGEVVYKQEGITDFSAKVYFTTTITNKVDIYTSPDGINWASLSISNDTPVNTLGTWYRTYFRPSTGIPFGTNYLKIAFSNDTNIWSPQLSRVTMTHRSDTHPSDLASTDNINDYSKIYSHSSNWYFDASNSSYMEGDTSRLTRTDNNWAEVVYKQDGITDFSIKVYYISSITNKVSVYTSTDGTNWSPLAITYDPSVNTSGTWYRTYVKPSAEIPSGTNYIKIAFSNDANVWSPQLSQVTIMHTPVLALTDNINDYSKIYSHSSNWYFDSSNSSYMEGDTSRLTRTTDTWGEVVYKQDGITDFSVKVYYVSSINNKVSFYTSYDGTNWTSLTNTYDVPLNTSGTWYRTNFKPSVKIPFGTNYIKIAFSNDTNIWSPQLSQVTLYK